jgi:transposase
LPGKEGLTTIEREELVRPRRQLRQVRMERDIRKRTVIPPLRAAA